MSECQRCGDCCKWLDFLVSNIGVQPDMVEFYKARGCTVTYNNKKGVDRMYVSVPFECPNLAHMADGTYTCIVQDDKPAACKDWECQKGEDLGEEVL